MCLTKESAAWENQEEEGEETPVLWWLWEAEESPPASRLVSESPTSARSSSNLAGPMKNPLFWSENSILPQLRQGEDDINGDPRHELVLELSLGLFLVTPSSS